MNHSDRCIVARSWQAAIDCDAASTQYSPLPLAGVSPFAGDNLAVSPRAAFPLREPLWEPLLAPC